MTESHGGRAGAEGGGGNYKGWLGTNFPSVQFSPQPIVGPTISTEGSAETEEEVGTHNMYLQPRTMNACRGQEEEEEEPSSVPLEVNILTLTFGTEHKPTDKEEKDEPEKEETKAPSASLEVNILTLTFGGQHEEKEEEEGSHPLSQLTAGAESAEQWTLEGEREVKEEEESHPSSYLTAGAEQLTLEGERGENEEEEEVVPDYIGRS